MPSRRYSFRRATASIRKAIPVMHEMSCRNTAFEIEVYASRLVFRCHRAQTRAYENHGIDVTGEADDLLAEIRSVCAIACENARTRLRVAAEHRPTRELSGLERSFRAELDAASIAWNR